MLKEILEKNAFDKHKELIRQKKQEIKDAEKNISNYNGGMEDEENYLYDEALRLKAELKNIIKGKY